MSLRRIPVEQAVPGMFIHSLDAPWVAHPFWRSRFALQGTADVRALRASGVAHCWIDVSRGADVVTTSVANAAAGSASAADAAQDRPAQHGVATLLGHEYEHGRGQRMGPHPRTAAGSPEPRHAERLAVRAREAVRALFTQARTGQAVCLDQSLAIVDELAAMLASQSGALVGLVRLQRKDDYTFAHSVAVCTLMIALAHQMGLSAPQVREAGLCGLLHDVGKLMVPRHILDKPGKLTPEEFRVMQAHPRHGVDILRRGGAVPHSVIDVCLHHHEKLDGSGYPHGLAGAQISLFARMAAVCDVYDAVTSERAYKNAWDPAIALGRMAQWEGHFDSAVLHAVVRVVGIYPVGSLVRLASGRLAVVVEHNPAALTAPKVRVFFSLRSSSHTEQRVVDLSLPGEADHIVAREDPHASGFPRIAHLWQEPH